MSNSKNNNKKTSEKAKLMSKWQKMPYTNRELSWVDFNARVLEEAFKKTNPIMERCNFLSITASNLDEFFMVRVAGVLDQIHHGRTSRDASGMTSTEVMDGLVEKIHEFACIIKPDVLTIHYSLNNCITDCIILTAVFRNIIRTGFRS